MSKAVITRVQVDDRGSGKIERASRTVRNYGNAWRKTAGVTQRAMRGIDRGFARLNRGMGTLMRRAKFMMIGFQITASIMGVSMVRAAMKYERALRNVTSLMAGAGMAQADIEKNFRAMDAQIKSMAVRTGQMPTDLAAGMYNVVSATFDGAAGLKVLEAAAVGAFAGLSSTETTTGLLTKTLQAYREEGETNMDVAKKSQGVMDAYFMAVNRGMFTFDDLATKMGALPSTASAFGVSLEDLLGFLSTATVRGVGLDEAITGVRQAMLQVGKLTPQTEKAAQTLFGPDYKEKWGAEALAANGLYGTLLNLNEVLPDVPANVLEAAIAMEDEGGDAAGYLAEQLGANVAAVAELFPNIRALKAVLAVTGPGLELYGENMEFMADSAGAAGRAQDEMAKSAEGSLQYLKAAWETFKIEVGSIALPFIKEISDGMVGWWEGIPESFAKSRGLKKEDWTRMLAPDDAAAVWEGKVGEMWADASPAEKVTFILREAWSDALTNLTNWFQSGGGKEKITNFGNMLGTALANTLKSLAGVDVGEAVSESLPYQMGKAFVDGFTAAFEDFDWAAFFDSTIGTALATIIGGLFLGPGGAAGAFAGSSTGINPILGALAGAGAWKGGGMLLTKLLAGGGAGGTAAATTTAAASGGAGGTGALAGLGLGGSAAIAGSAALLAAPVVGLYMSGKKQEHRTQVANMTADQSAVAQALIQFGNAEGKVLGAAMATEVGQVLETFDAQTRAEFDEDLAGRSVSDSFGRMTGINEVGALAEAMSELGIGNLSRFGPNPQMSDFAGGTGVGGLDWSKMGDAMAGVDWEAALGNAPDTLDSAAQTQEMAANQYTVAGDRLNMGATVFGAWVRALPSTIKVTASGTLSSGGSGSTGGRNKRMALGGSGTVYKPTMFMAGEAGPEDYNFTPRRSRGSGGGDGGGGTVVNAKISVTEAGDGKATAAYIVRELEKAVFNG